MHLYRYQLIFIVSLAFSGQLTKSRLLLDRQTEFDGKTVDSQYVSSQDSDYQLGSGIEIDPPFYSLESDSQVSSTQERSSTFVIERFKKCGKRDFCQGRDPIQLQAPLFKTGDIWGRIMCFCDNDCYIYGDCCLDKVISPEKPDVIQGHSSRYWGCIPTNGMDVMGIVSCDEDSQLSKLCSKSNGSNVLFDIPVISKSKSTVYANVYCALCHSIKPSDISFTKYSIECLHNNTLETDDLEYKNLAWYNKNSSKTECEIQISGFPPNSRKCYSGLIDSCPSDQHNLTQACSVYSLPIRNYETSEFFKNPHCALCNGENIAKHFMCMTPFKTKFGSLNMLVDFNWNFDTCHWPQTLWDDASKSCLPLNCQSDTCYLVEPDNGTTEAVKSEENGTQFAESYITLVVLLISIFLLLLHIILYYLEPKRQNIPSQILKNLSLSIILGHISFLVVDTKRFVPFPLCKAISLSTQFFYIASFLWMNVMSYDVWRTFSKVSLRGSSSNIIKKYNFYSWGCSACIVLLTLTSDLFKILPENFRPHLGMYRYCWFSDELVLGIYFFLPIFAILLVNLYFFGKTVLWFQKQTSKEFERVNNEATGRKEYKKIWLYVKLSIIMGLTWLFCVVSALTRLQVFRYIFIISNGLQGAIIFIMFDLKKAKLAQVVDSFRSKTSWTSNSTDAKHLQTKDTTSTHITRNLTSLSLKLNNVKK